MTDHTIANLIRLKELRERKKYLKSLPRVQLPAWKVEELREIYESGLVEASFLAWIYGTSRQHIHLLTSYKIRPSLTKDFAP